MIDVSTLATRTVGDRGPHVVFVHGLFGQGRNFATIAATLARSGHRVTLVDLPNHGHSPWRDGQDYVEMAELVDEVLTGIPDGPVTLVGHSMGGKTAMTLALRHPGHLAGLVVVDIAPVEYPAARNGDEFARFIAAMQALELTTLTDRRQADAELAGAVDNQATRAFLLQSLVREGDGWRWRLNLDVLARSLAGLAGFPDPGDAHFDGPTLWIAGADSPYVREEYRPRMDALFPETRLVRIKGAGHWVHSEQPSVFVDVITRFVDAIAG